MKHATFFGGDPYYIKKEKHPPLRINKYLSEAQFCSRRKADILIADQRVNIEGNVAQLGDVVSSHQKVYVDNDLIAYHHQVFYLILNKPKGITSTTDQNIKGNLVDFLNLKTRIFPVGRLDKESTGLLIMTNDGDIVNDILQSANHHKKYYRVNVNKKITPQFINQLRTGVKIYNPVKNHYEITQPCEVKKIDAHTFEIILTQGLNRQIRRMCQAFDYQVLSLHRYKIMNIQLEHIPIGSYRYLTKKELDELFIRLNMKQAIEK